MTAVDDIKNIQKAKTALLRLKIKELMDSMGKVEDGTTTVFVNGESEELQKHCAVAKAAIRLKSVP